jgi:hypothetical protein
MVSFTALFAIISSLTTLASAAPLGKLCSAHAYSVSPTHKLKSPEPVCEYSGAETEIEERQFSWPGFGGLGSGSGSCNRYEVISARGTGELQAFPTGNRGTVDGILNAVSGGSNYEVMYPGKSSNKSPSFCPLPLPPT